MNGKVRINLLPPELAGKAGKSRAGRPAGGGIGEGPNPLLVILAVAFFIVALYLCYTMWDKTNQVQRHYDETLTRKERLQADVEALRSEFREFVEARDLILSLSEVLDAIDPENRIIWSEKLLMLADLVPDNVHITRIRVIEKERQVITEESKRAIQAWERGGQVGPKPEEIKKPIIHQELTISALARKDKAQEAFNPILAFLNSMVKYERPRQDSSVRRFMENFVDDPRYSEIKSTGYDGVEVYQFDIYLKTKPLSAQKYTDDGKTPDESEAGDETVTN